MTRKRGGPSRVARRTRRSSGTRGAATKPPARKGSARGSGTPASAPENGRYKDLVEHLPVALYVNQDDRIVLANAACVALFGAASLEQILGRSPLEFYDPSDHATIRERVGELRARRVALPSVVHTVVRLDGERRRVEVVASSFDTSGAPATHVVLRDITDHLRADEALRVSEERYRTDFEHSASGRCIVSPEGRIVRANKSLAEMLGREPATLVGVVVDDLLHPEDLERNREMGLRALRGELTAFRREGRYLRGDGTFVWLDMGTTLLRSSTGAPLQFMADANDITLRKRAEAESALRGARLELLTNSVSQLAACKSVDAVAAVVRAAARALVGADSATLVVREGDECRHVEESSPGPLWKDERVPLNECVSGWAMAQGSQLAFADVGEDPRAIQAVHLPTRVRGLIVTPVGAKDAQAAIGVYWAARHTTSAEELGVLRALADSTSVALENVAAFGELVRRKERYRNLIETLDDIVFSVDCDGRLTYVSGAVSKYGFTAAEVLGRPFQDFTHPDDRGAAGRGIAERLLRDAGPCEYRVIDAGGKVRFVRSSGRRIIEEGRVAGLAGVLTDLTAQRSTEEQLRVAQKIEAIGRLAGGVAHDFNNILTVITSYAALAARGLGEGDARRAALVEVRKASDRATALTRQLLAFSRRQVLQPVIVDVNELVTGMGAMLKRLIGEDVDLAVTKAPDAGRILADPGQVEQVLMNLAVNARDAMPEGGRLVIETANAELDEAFVARNVGAQTGRFVMLRVSDTGCGMDAETRRRLFEPFFTTKPVGKGTGLGLSTAYGIVKQSGGSIWVASEPGHGAVFDVYFPRVEGEASARAPRAAQVDAVRLGETILLVEDDEAVRNLARQVLQEDGFEVLSAANGGEALVLAERWTSRIDLVVTDMVMPGMSGRDLAQRLERLLRGVPVLFVSGYSDDAMDGRGALATGTLVLPKPFTPEVLVNRVREVLVQRR